MSKESAFPVIPPSDARGCPPEGYPYPETGMTLRDYMAIHAGLGDGPSVLAAEGVMGSKAPQWAPGDGLTCTLWWTEAEARIRYIYADAMLKQRESL